MAESRPKQGGDLAAAQRARVAAGAVLVVEEEEVCLRCRARAGRAGYRKGAGLETVGLVHEPNSAMNPRAKSGGFDDLRYTRQESASAGCSARLADYIDTEGVRVVQKT